MSEGANTILQIMPQVFDGCVYYTASGQDNYKVVKQTEAVLGLCLHRHRWIYRLTLSKGSPTGYTYLVISY